MTDAGDDYTGDADEAKAAKEVLTVGNLLKALRAIPKEGYDYIVLSEGCDCDGAAAGFVVDTDDRTLLITRHKYWSSGGFPELKDRS